MKEPVIFNDVDFQYNDQNLCNFLRYKGQPFTGRLLITPNSQKGNEIIEYQEGKAHGHDMAFYPDGKPLADKVYHQGHCVEQKEWYHDGKPKKDWDADKDYCWDADGLLAKDNTRWLYKNGQPVEDQNQEQALYFSPNGNLAIKKVYTAFGNGRHCCVSYYYHHVLSRCFEDIFTNYYPALDEKFSRHQLLPDWLNVVYQEDHDLGHHLMDCLSNHPTPQTRETAAQLKSIAVKQENLELQAGDIHQPLPDHIVVKLNFDTRF